MARCFHQLKREGIAGVVSFADPVTRVAADGAVVAPGHIGTVYKARDPFLKRDVAIKVISPDIELTDELTERFKTEAAACARLKSEHIVTIDTDSAPRIMFYGENLMMEDLPVGTRVIYPKRPMTPVANPVAAIRYALNHPEDSEPLHAMLKWEAA